MKITLPYLLILLCSILVACQEKVDDNATRQEILDNGQIIRDAFSAGDVDKIKALHHPEVVKALGYKDLKRGRAEVMQGLEER
ncbi:MAG: hypothetical protein AAF847_14765 [Bacteroidota bacterium]